MLMELGVGVHGLRRAFWRRRTVGSCLLRRRGRVPRATAVGAQAGGTARFAVSEGGRCGVGFGVDGGDVAAGGVLRHGHTSVGTASSTSSSSFVECGMLRQLLLLVLGGCHLLGCRPIGVREGTRRGMRELLLLLKETLVLSSSGRRNSRTTVILSAAWRGRLGG